MSNIKEIKMEEMTQLRELSRKVSTSLEQELGAYLKTLTPLFSPRKVLGEYMSGTNKDKVLGAEKNFAIIEEQYKDIMLEGFNYSAKLSSVIPMVASKLSLYNWMYRADLGGMDLNIVSPVKWVLGYENSVSIKSLFQSNSDGKNVSQEDASEFVISKLVIAKLLENTPSLITLIKGLGYTINVETHPEVSGKLPYVVLSAPIEAFRPQDDMVKMAAQFSGASSFEELLDNEALDAIPNHFQDKIRALV